MTTTKITLHTAIEATKNGLKSLNVQVDHLNLQIGHLVKKRDAIKEEVALRATMLETMQKLQEYLGDKETITFFIPEPKPE